jgi:hypothetical protein
MSHADVGTIILESECRSIQYEKDDAIAAATGYFYRIQVGDRHFRVTPVTIACAPVGSRLRDSVEALDEFVQDCVEAILGQKAATDSTSSAFEEQAAFLKRKLSQRLTQHRAIISIDSLISLCESVVHLAPQAHDFGSRFPNATPATLKQRSAL